MSRHRLVVRTPGFHPGNGGSIPPGGAKIDFSQTDFVCLFYLSCRMKA